MPDIVIYTIPSEYYGGAAPKKRAQPKEEAPGIALPKETKVRKITPARLFIIVAATLFVIVIAVATWYFTRELRAPTPPQAAPVAPAELPSAEPPLSAPAESPAPLLPPPAPLPAEPIPQAVIAPPAPPQLSADPDRDELTEAEEVLYGTNSTMPDSDSDGYLDGHEVVNLYNPAGIAPQRLEDAGLALRYIGTDAGLEVLYPRPWRANPEEGGRRIVFQSPDGDAITLALIANVSAMPFDEWVAVQEDGKDLTAWIGNKQGRKAFLAGDSAIYVEAAENSVAVLRYIPAGESGTERYDLTLKMMANSFSVRE